MTEKIENKSLIPISRIEQKIYSIRGQNVMFDTDLADLYEVETKVLNQAVKRNIERFPKDFMFQLTEDEFAEMRSWSQFVTSSRKFRRAAYRPNVFTEQGVAMLSSVLRSPRAVQVNIEIIMRAFVKLRVMSSSHEDLAGKVEEMEKKYDKNFKAVFDALRNLLAPDKNTKKIGFVDGKVRKAVSKK